MQEQRPDPRSRAPGSRPAQPASRPRCATAPQAPGSRPRHRRRATTAVRSGPLRPSGRVRRPDRANPRSPYSPSASGAALGIGSGRGGYRHRATIAWPAGAAKRSPAASSAPIIAGDQPGRARRPAGVDRKARRRARGRAFDRRGQRRRGQLALAHQLGGAERGQTLGPQGLFGLAPGGERHQHRARPRRQQVEDGVVAGLADRNPAGAQQRRRNRRGTARSATPAGALARSAAKSPSGRFVPVMSRQGRWPGTRRGGRRAPLRAAPARPRRRRPRRGSRRQGTARKVRTGPRRRPTFRCSQARRDGLARHSRYRRAGRRYRGPAENSRRTGSARDRHGPARGRCRGGRDRRSRDAAADRRARRRCRAPSRGSAGRHGAARAAAISGSSSKRNARRANGNPSRTTASGRDAAKTASSASRRRSRSRSSIGAPASSISAKLASRARSGGSWTSATAGSCGRLCGMPPETTVTAIPCSTRASAMRSARCRCPIPSRCCTQNSTERFAGGSPA